MTLYVTDTHGASDSYTATVTVEDIEPPFITSYVPDTVASVNSNCQAALPDVTIGFTAVDNCTAQESLIVTQTPPAGTLVGLGTTNVTVSVTDASGNSDSIPTRVHVIDEIPPSITCPSNQSFPATSPTGATVNYPAAVATDNCSVSVVSAPASGSFFPIGDTTVSCRVRGRSLASQLST